MLTAGYEPTTPGSEQPQTNALDRAATVAGFYHFTLHKMITKERLTEYKTRK
jgi:hypothetical protein